MAKITGKYETIFIVTPVLDEEATQAIVDKFKALIEEHSTNVEVDEWGRRRLAYPIHDQTEPAQDQTEGYYVLIRFDSAPAFPAELDRVYNITDGIMRSLIVCLDE